MPESDPGPAQGGEPDGGVKIDKSGEACKGEIKKEKGFEKTRSLKLFELFELIRSARIRSPRSQPEPRAGSE
jgi:hypothetical protein